MSYIEGLPSIYQGMVERGVFIPKTAVPQSSIFDDPFSELDEMSAVSAVEELLTPGSGSSSEDKLIELMDPSGGRQGAERNADAVELLVFEDPIEKLRLRSHGIPETSSVTVMYEGIEVVHEVEHPLAPALEQTKYWQNEESSEQSKTVESLSGNGLKQAVQRVLAVSVYRNPHLTDVHLGISQWSHMMDKPISVPAAAENRYHLVAYKSSTNIAMSQLEDTEVRDRFYMLYGTTPVGSRMDPVRGILFEGDMISKGDGTAVFKPIFHHMPKDIADTDEYQRLQRENAAQYLRAPSIGQPSLISRLLHPGSSRLLIG